MTDAPAVDATERELRAAWAAQDPGVRSAAVTWEEIQAHYRATWHPAPEAER